MAIIHIVLFQFKASASDAQVEEICDQMLALRNQCVHPTSKQPYVKSSVGGKDSSPEGHQGGLTHGFVVEFENDEDRRYYLEEDPAHIAFTKRAGEVVQKVTVVDFTPGVF